MSVTFRTFTCDRCDLHVINLISAGIFEWVEGSLTYSNPRRLCVCASCRGISVAEVIPPWEELIDEMWLSRLSRIRKRLIAFAAGGLHRLPPRIRDALDPRSGFRLLLKIVNSDRSPVCLRCGSSDFQYLNLPAHYHDRGELFRTDHRHPGCNGHILVHGSGGERLGPEIVTRHYDLNGHQTAGPLLGDEPVFLSGYTPPLR